MFKLINYLNHNWAVSAIIGILNVDRKILSAFAMGAAMAVAIEKMFGI